MKSIDAGSILSLSRDFMACRILLSGAELDLFTLLTTPLSAEEIAERTGGSLRSMTVLLDALAALDLLTKEGNIYRCLPPVSHLLSADAPGSVLPMVMHAASLWRRWSHLTDVVKGTETSKGSPSTARSLDELRSFIGAMNVVAAPQAQQIADAVSAGPAKALIDVGGGAGTYTAAFLGSAPDMRATLFDLSPVTEIARQHLSEAGLLDRVTLVSGDFYRDELPGGHDLAFLSAIIHQNSMEQNLGLFRKVFNCLQPGGRIVIRDHVMEPDRTHPREGAIFAVNMLVGTEGGGTYTFAEIEAGLAAAGFVNIRLLKAGKHMDALVEAFKP